MTDWLWSVAWKIDQTWVAVGRWWRDRLGLD